MPYVESTFYGYKCERCGKVVEAASPWADDYPEGYFVSMRRVTEAQRHYLNDSIYLCTKECLVDYVTYGISASTGVWRPIARTELSKKRSDRELRPWGLKTEEERILKHLPTLPPAESTPLDPDTFEPNKET